MEPSGRNQWQPVANARSLKSAETSQNRLPWVCDRLPFGAHGKERIDGSSPSEGYRKGQQMAFFVALTHYGYVPTRPRSVPKTCPQHTSDGGRSWLEHRLWEPQSTSVIERSWIRDWHGVERIPTRAPEPVGDMTELLVSPPAVDLLARKSSWLTTRAKGSYRWAPDSAIWSSRSTTSLPHSSHRSEHAWRPDHCSTRAAQTRTADIIAHGCRWECQKVDASSRRLNTGRSRVSPDAPAGRPWAARVEVRELPGTCAGRDAHHVRGCVVCVSTRRARLERRQQSRAPRSPGGS
jgi:hypothetical protein